MTEKELALELAKLIVPMHVSSENSVNSDAETAMECYLACLRQISINSAELQ